MRVINKIKDYILYTVAVVLVGSNLFNYFYCYKQLGDELLQWRVAIIAIAIELFLLSLYTWLIQIKKVNSGFKAILTGWTTVFLLINLFGVILGYNLHTKGFMAILFSATIIAFIHLLIKWLRCF
jgi:ABC-type multidrug transport system permease subunit